jgi:hypothetical protein
MNIILGCMRVNTFSKYYFSENHEKKFRGYEKKKLANTSDHQKVKEKIASNEQND